MRGRSEEGRRERGMGRRMERTRMDIAVLLSLWIREPVPSAALRPGHQRCRLWSGRGHRWCGRGPVGVHLYVGGGGTSLWQNVLDQWIISGLCRLMRR